MDKEEFDEADKKLTRRQRLLLTLLTMEADRDLPVDERIARVEERHTHLIERGLLDPNFLDKEFDKKTLETLRRDLHKKLAADEERMQDVARRAVYDHPLLELEEEPKEKKKKKPPKRDYMYG